MTRSGENADEEFLFGIHPVAEALELRRGRIERILVARETRGGRIGRILKKARLEGVPVSYLPKNVLSRRVGGRAVHQGIAAQVSSFEYTEPEVVLESARGRRDGLIVALDRVEDPRNLGAVIRSAAAAGADGIVLASDATVGVTAAARKTSAGAVERIPVARSANLSSTLRTLREDGFLVAGLDPRADSAWDEPDWTGKVVLVAGGEEKGPRPRVLRECNKLVAIPLAGGVESLNVSVAVGIVLWEGQRQRRRL